MKAGVDWGWRTKRSDHELLSAPSSFYPNENKILQCRTHTPKLGKSRVSNTPVIPCPLQHILFDRWRLHGKCEAASTRIISVLILGISVAPSHFDSDQQGQPFKAHVFGNWFPGCNPRAAAQLVTGRTGFHCVRGFGWLHLSLLQNVRNSVPPFSSRFKSEWAWLVGIYTYGNFGKLCKCIQLYFHTYTCMCIRVYIYI